MSDRYFPKAEVEFVAKAGFITKETWETFFFQGGTPRWRHMAWASLVSYGYMMPHTHKRLRNVYVLNRLNRKVSDFVDGRAARPPAPTQIDHDDALNRGLLLAERAKLISTWTPESELKALGAGRHRIETQGQLVKYPDAVVQLAGVPQKVVLAIEMEMTLKNRSRYVQIMSAYSAMKDLHSILFICKLPVIETAIREAAAKTFFPVDRINLAFMPLKAWQDDPLESAIQIVGKRQGWLGFRGLHSHFTE